MRVCVRVYVCVCVFVCVCLCVCVALGLLAYIGIWFRQKKTCTGQAIAKGWHAVFSGQED